LLAITLSYLVQANKLSGTDLVLSQECDAFFTICNVVNYNVVKDSTCRGDSTIVFLIDCAQVSYLPKIPASTPSR
jgi:hypothetical protein